MLEKGLNIILDAQWGSTGKGKLSGLLGSFKEKPTLACSSFGPNAGHTYVDNDGKATVFKFLSTACITAGCPALVMPDSVIDPVTLLNEQGIANVDVFVHPRTAIVTAEDEKNAKVTGRHISGTMKGTGHAMARKMLRIEGTRLAKDVLPKNMIRDTCEMVRTACEHGERVLMEMSQGFDLSLNHGHEYPYTTSRDLTIGAALNSCGCPPRVLAQVIGCMRTYPIRVGNVGTGNSGPCHPDQTEISWADVAESSHGPTSLQEKTTVTQRVRRVFTFSMMQMKRFVAVNNPDWFFLNFVHYLDWSMHEKKELDDLTPSAIAFISNLASETNVPVFAVGTGAKNNEIIEVGYKGNW